MNTILEATTMLAQAVASEPNWGLIGVIVAVLLIVIVALVFPKKKAIDEDKSDKKLPEEHTKKDASDVNLENYEEKKEKLSLAEIKVAKRQTADDMSKEELRELRKERRAATQTEKAVREHEEGKDTAEESETKSTEHVSNTENKAVGASEEIESSKSEAASEAKSTDASVETTHETSDASAAKSDVSADKDEAAVAADNQAENSEITIDDENVVIKSDVDTKDVFESLFGDTPASFDDPFAGFSDPFADTSDASGDDSAPVFQQTLGSQLISLDELTKAAAEADVKQKEDWEELTKRLVEKSEKKTLN